MLSKSGNGRAEDVDIRRPIPPVRSIAKLIFVLKLLADRPRNPDAKVDINRRERVLRIVSLIARLKKQ
jgi:hypothetical protein